MVLYKYLKSEDLRKFERKGSIRLGTLEGYRNEESKRIGDPFEGKTVFRFETKDDEVKLSWKQTNALFNDYVSVLPFTIGSHTYFKSDLIVPNALVFSTSRKFDPDYWQREYGYDAHYRIRDVQAFTKCVIESVLKNHAIVFSRIGMVKYVPTKDIRVTNENKHEVLRTEGLPDFPSEVVNLSRVVKPVNVVHYFTKPDKFERDEESRIIVVPRNYENLEPLIMECPKLLNFCETGMG